MVTVPAIGIEKALRIFYRANTLLFTATTDFAGARSATAQAAIDLYGSCSAEWRAVHTAWDAVAVPGTWTPCM
jgi:vibriolysin